MLRIDHGRMYVNGFNLQFCLFSEVSVCTVCLNIPCDCSNGTLSQVYF